MGVSGKLQAPVIVSPEHNPHVSILQAAWGPRASPNMTSKVIQRGIEHGHSEQRQ